MLRIVHPVKQGQETRPRFSRLLTTQESNRIRAALKNLRRAYGGWDVVAALTGYAVKTLQCAASETRHPMSATLALAIATIAGVPLESLLSPLKSVNVCPTCGARKGAR